MVKVDDRWSFERDKWCWVLYENTKGVKKKTKEEIDVANETYHANLDQVCRYIIDKEAGNAREVEDLRRVIRNVAQELSDLIKQQGVVNG